MTRLLTTVTDHARRAITALLEHVDVAWDCWGAPEDAQDGAVGPQGGRVDSGSAGDLKGAQIGTEACGGCGQPPRGLASIGDTPYCHEDADPTCYQRASRATFAPAPGEDFLGSLLADQRQTWNERHEPTDTRETR